MMSAGRVQRGASIQSMSFTGSTLHIIFLWDFCLDTSLKQGNRRRGAAECSKSGKAAEKLSAVSGRFGEGGGGAEEDPGQDLPHPQPQKRDEDGGAGQREQGEHQEGRSHEDAC